MSENMELVPDEYSSSYTAAVRPTSMTSSTMNTKAIVTAKDLKEQPSSTWNSADTVQQTASMKIFTSVMLHAWRQRRADVHRLKLVVERLQKSSMQTKNELHVCNTMIRVEQRRCSELQLELKKSNLNITKVRNSCDVLSTSLETMRADKEELQQELHLAKREFHELEHSSRRCKDELLSALLEQRELQHQLTQEQQLIRLLNKEKRQLLDEVTQMRNMETQSTHREQVLLRELEQKVQTLENMTSMIEKLERRLAESTNPVWIPRKSASTETDGIVRPLRLYPNVNQLIDWNDIDQFLTRVKNCTATTAYFIWRIVLPYKSMRYGCMFTPKIQQIQE